MWACQNSLHIPMTLVMSYFLILFPVWTFIFLFCSTVPVTDPRVQQVPNRTLIEAAHIAKHILT